MRHHSYHSMAIKILQKYTAEIYCSLGCWLGYTTFWRNQEMECGSSTIKVLHRLRGLLQSFPLISACRTSSREQGAVSSGLDWKRPVSGMTVSSGEKIFGFIGINDSMRIPCRCLPRRILQLTQVGGREPFAVELVLRTPDDFPLFIIHSFEFSWGRQTMTYTKTELLPGKMLGQLVEGKPKSQQ